MNIIIIPAYNPKNNLKELILELKHKTSSPIVIINDGSKEECGSIFAYAESKGCHVVPHYSNKGKGASIKTGIEYAQYSFNDCSGFITMDADGQHITKDFLAVSKSLDEHPESLILGVRNFDDKSVPFKSKVGNKFSAFYFKHATKTVCSDTQTGLRGIPLSMVEEALAVEENRYDYEMTFLMNIAKSDNEIIEVPIETVYLDNNNSSHFRPIVDSLKIYKKPVRFSIISISSALIDLGLFSILTSILDEEIAVLVFIATVLARLVSGSYNFMLNRIWSFESKTPIKKQFVKYASLYLVQLSLSIILVILLSMVSVHLTVIKIIVDSMLFIGSYFIQKNWVFQHKAHPVTMNQA